MTDHHTVEASLARGRRMFCGWLSMICLGLTLFVCAEIYYVLKAFEPLTSTVIVMRAP